MLNTFSYNDRYDLSKIIWLKFQNPWKLVAVKSAFLEHESIKGKIVAGDPSSFSRISLIKKTILSGKWSSSEFFFGPIIIFDTALS